jgi:hypothetical protein
MLLIALLTSAPAFGQSRIYTNADLGRPLSPSRPTPTADELSALAAHQFTLPPDYPSGPHVVILGEGRASSTPWDWPREMYEPIPPFAEPWGGLPLYMGGDVGGRHYVTPRMSPRGLASVAQQSARRAGGVRTSTSSGRGQARRGR